MYSSTIYRWLRIDVDDSMSHAFGKLGCHRNPLVDCEGANDDKVLIRNDVHHLVKNVVTSIISFFTPFLFSVLIIAYIQ